MMRPRRSRSPPDTFIYGGTGPGGKYRGSYPNKTLDGWAEYVKKWRRQGRDVFVYFPNDQKAAAPRDAVRLMSRLE